MIAEVWHANQSFALMAPAQRWLRCAFDPHVIIETKVAESKINKNLYGNIII